MIIRSGQHIALAGLVLALNPFGTSAQSPQGFEVASIKPHRAGGDSSDRKLLPGGRFIGNNVSIRTIIRIALGVEDNLIVGAPSWTDSETYDIDAKTGHAADIAPDELPKLMLALLEERFQFKFHRTTKEAPVYSLEVAKSGPKLKEHTDSSEPSMSTNSQGTKMVMTATKMTVQSLAASLKRQTGWPVVDHTGLKGEFDFELEWDRDDTPNSLGPSIFTALQEQLGLKLNAARGSVEILVIDRVERASEN
jgi:uncharacterized protein (TIGR03435 family)